jgi:maltose-binding protein MalE
MSIQKAEGISTERRKRAFHEAITYEQFVSSAKVNVDRLHENFERYQLNEQELAYFEGRSELVDVLVLAHDWCGDVVANLPLFGKIEQVTDKIKLHIVPRDPDNQDIAAAYLHADGRNHIPTYVFFNQAGEELGYFSERPDAITHLNRQWVDDFWTLHSQ